MQLILAYKIIISKNVSSEAQVKNSFLISQKKFVVFSRYLSFYIFNHPMIYQICDLMMREVAFFNTSFELQPH